VRIKFHIRWCSCHLTVTRRVSRVKQELLALPEHLSSPQVFSGFAVLCRSLSALLQLTDSDYSFSISKLSSFIHLNPACTHKTELCVILKILWRNVCSSNLQHVKVWNDKFASYLLTSCGFQQVFMFSLLLKACLYGVAEN
jgi:hypothetical protein